MERRDSSGPAKPPTRKLAERLDTQIMLVNCVAYRQGQKLADIPLPDVPQYLSQQNCFVWVALKDPDAEELALLQEEFDLHDLAVEDARGGHQRPKIEEYGPSLFIVVQSVELADDKASTPADLDLRRRQLCPVGASRHAVRIR